MFLGFEREHSAEELSEKTRATFALYVPDLDDRAKQISLMTSRDLEVCEFHHLEVCEARFLFTKGVDESEMAILGYAWCLSRFHKSHAFDIQTGRPTQSRVDGHARIIQLDD